MNKQTSYWILIPIILIAFVMMVGGLMMVARGLKTEHQIVFGQGYKEGYQAGQDNFQPQVITQIEYVEVEKKAGYDFRLSDNTTMSLHEAILFTEGNIRSHQYYLDHPELQTSGSGNSTFQIRMIGQYNRLLQFLKGIMKMEE